MPSDADYAPEYLEFIELFNRGEYDTANRTLIAAWQRNMGDRFYKGLIQLAGAFVHWHEGSLFWAEDLLASAHNLLAEFAPECDGLDVETLLADIRKCNSLVHRARTSNGDRTNTPLPAITLQFVG